MEAGSLVVFEDAGDGESGGFGASKGLVVRGEGVDEGGRDGVFGG